MSFTNKFIIFTHEFWLKCCGKIIYEIDATIDFSAKNRSLFTSIGSSKFGHNNVFSWSKIQICSIYGRVFMTIYSII